MQKIMFNFSTKINTYKLLSVAIGRRKIYNIVNYTESI